MNEQKSFLFLSFIIQLFFFFDIATYFSLYFYFMDSTSLWRLSHHDTNHSLPRSMTAINNPCLFVCLSVSRTTNGSHTYNNTYIHTRSVYIHTQLTQIHIRARSLSSLIHTYLTLLRLFSKEEPMCLDICLSPEHAPCPDTDTDTRWMQHTHPPYIHTYLPSL